MLSASTGSDVSYLPPTDEAAADGGTATVTIAATGLASQTLTIALAAAPPAPGRHWATLRDAGVRWQDVASDGTLYVAYGDRGRIATSPDGRTWTPHATGENDTLSALSPDGPDLRALAFVNGQFVAVGANELMLSSSH